MPLITDRAAVLALFAEAARKGWVVPAFGTENLTTTEAILTAVRDYGASLGVTDLPVMLAATNHYPERTQTAYYTHTRDCHIGLELLLADLAVLTGENSPFGSLRVMIHLDHIQPELDAELLRGNLNRFSSIMFDASTRPLDENIALTREFVNERHAEIVIEGACDYVGHKDSLLTEPREAERFARETNVDWIVANLGTEHRAGASALRYARERAQEISRQIGHRLVLHGTSSVTAEELPNLFTDGIVKVNLWTALERDSSGPLLHEMICHAAGIAGAPAALEWSKAGLLGPKADTTSAASLPHFTTAWRQEIVFDQIKKIVTRYLHAWYPASARP